MGKKRIVKTEGEAEGAAKQVSTSSKRHVESGRLCVESTYNNTKLVLTDKNGNVIKTSSSGSLGFKGAKKGTPFAAAKVGETLGTVAHGIGMREVNVIVKGVGSGRESSIRGFISKGINIVSIKDVTPIPFNGPKPKKPRRV